MIKNEKHFLNGKEYYPLVEKRSRANNGNIFIPYNQGAEDRIIKAILMFGVQK